MTAGRSYTSPYSPYASPRPKPAPPPSLPTPSHSPPRKVVTDFAAFGAPKNVSVFGTAVASTPFSLAGGKAAFGGIRNSGRGFDDDDEDDGDGGSGMAVPDDGRQKIELREDAITLDQARRIAMQSAWRSARV